MLWVFGNKLLSKWGENSVLSASHYFVSSVCYKLLDVGAWMKLTGFVSPALHEEPYILFSTENKSMLCIKCFRDMQVWVNLANRNDYKIYIYRMGSLFCVFCRESRTHCIDIETAYAHGCEMLDQAVLVRHCSSLYNTHYGHNLLSLCRTDFKIYHVISVHLCIITENSMQGFSLHLSPYICICWIVCCNFPQFKL